ncbi:hypothetical protein E9565_19985, partial [Blastococcus sp. KM273129]|nr:hypothetical protein [Blastococcus sp. KM273129]
MTLRATNPDLLCIDGGTGEAVRPRSWHARRGSAGPPTLDRVSAPASSPAYARPTRARRRCRGDRDWSPSV